MANKFPGSECHYKNKHESNEVKNKQEKEKSGELILKAQGAIEQLAAVRTRYECTLCRKSFSREFTLKDHQGIHEGKTHRCTTCEKSFSLARSLYSNLFLTFY